MTEIEVLLTGIVWVGYGIFAIVRTEDLFEDANDGDVEAIISAVGFVMFAPLVFIAKALYGIFKKYRS